MPLKSLAALAICLCILAAGPLAAWWLVEPLRPGADWTPRLLTLSAALAAAGLATWFFQRRLSRQTNFLLELCRRLALEELDSPAPAPPPLPDLEGLAVAIQVLRESLVDYLSLYRRFFQAAPDMFLSLSPAGGRILDANEAFLRAVGMLRSEVLGRPAARFVTLHSGWDAALKAKSGLQRGQINSPGGTINIEASISLEPGPEDQPWILGAILRDVTRQEELHRRILEKSTALEEALEEIKDVEALKDQFLTTLSHELKTPLVSLKGFLQMMRQGRVKQEETKRTLDICWRNLTKLEGKINDLLDLARLTQAKEQFEMVPVELGALVTTGAENLRALAAERGVGLKLEGLGDGPAMVRGNAEKLVQLVDNLLVNAVKYNRENGDVLVSVSRRDDKVSLKVADSGVGMDRDQMAKIFNRFYRGAVSGMDQLEGLGIGLSLVQEIVRLHGGDIQVQSEPGVGTTFTVTLEACP